MTYDIMLQSIRAEYNRKESLEEQLALALTALWNQSTDTEGE